RRPHREAGCRSLADPRRSSTRSNGCPQWPQGNGGEGGIRTPVTLSRQLVFETSPFSRSGTSPRGSLRIRGAQPANRGRDRADRRAALQSRTYRVAARVLRPQPRVAVVARATTREGRRRAVVVWIYSFRSGTGRICAPREETRKQ